MKNILAVLISSCSLLSRGNGDDSLIDDQSNIEEAIQSDHLHSACNELENGVHWIRPFSGLMDNGAEWPNVKVRCQDGWTILDYDLDSYISHYFSSFTSYVKIFLCQNQISLNHTKIIPPSSQLILQC